MQYIVHWFPCCSDGKEFACSAEDPGSIPGLGRSPGGGHGNPLQYSCLENPMDRGAWRAIAHGVAKTQTQLEWLSTHFSPTPTCHPTNWRHSGKESSCQCRRHGFNPWVGKIPWRRKWQPTPVFLPGKFHGRGVWWATVFGVAKESDMTECTHTHTHLLVLLLYYSCYWP